jgi:hypothetical protein
VHEYASGNHASRQSGQQREGAPSTPRPPVAGQASPAQALALQRLAGNRATTATLARWAAHPDPSKKGVMLPDVVAADYLRFNPPQNS